MNYDDYMRSELWFRQRAYLLRIHGRKCNLCSQTNELEVHHLTYERLGAEEPEDVMILCVRCHNDLHRALRQYSATEKVIRQCLPITRAEYDKTKARLLPDLRGHSVLKGGEL